MAASLFLLAELDFRTQLQSVRAPSAPLGPTPIAPHACVHLLALMVCVRRRRNGLKWQRRLNDNLLTTSQPVLFGLRDARPSRPA